MSNPDQPTKEQYDAIMSVLATHPSGYELISQRNYEWVIIATIDMFTKAFMGGLLKGLGNSNNYYLQISRDEDKRTTLTISFYNP
jgi:hypothetical protein